MVCFYKTTKVRKFGVSQSAAHHCEAEQTKQHIFANETKQSITLIVNTGLLHRFAVRNYEKITKTKPPAQA
ncbi:MAG: hypothetical protein LBH30_06310 [Prevotellaceae bacterium]|nr:hypothetical protein [Prevotellaceae bacterium]